MNYIELVNQFWQCDIEHSFNGSETRLYFYLLHTCNSLRWKNPFTHSDAHLAAVSGMSVNTLKTARNRLKQAGLLEFTPGSQGRGQSHKATYKLSISDTLPDTLPANSLTVFPRTSDSINKLNGGGLKLGDLIFVYASTNVKVREMWQFCASQEWVEWWQS